MKKEITKTLQLAPELEQLMNRISAAKALNADSIAAPNISGLFMPLLGVESLALANLTFDTSAENILQLNATTTLYGQGVTIAAIFNLNGTELELVLNNMGTDIELSLLKMVTNGLIPPSSSFPTESWPKVAISGISFVLDSSASTFTIGTGGGAQWDFLGYTNLFIADPAINIVMTASGANAYYVIEAVGTLKSKDGKVDIAAAIQFPTGANSWRFGTTAPVPLSNAVSIIDALTDTDITGLLPQGFKDKLDTIEITSFSVKFDPSQAKIYTLDLQVTTTADWVIIENKLKLEKGVYVNFSASRNAPEADLAYSGSITGSAAINYADDDKRIIGNASIPIPLASGQDWQIALGNAQDNIGLARLIGVVPFVSDLLPSGLEKQLDKVVVDNLTVSFKFDNGFSFTNVAFAIHSDSAWKLPMLQSNVYLDALSFELNVPFPYDASKTSGSLQGNIQISNGTITIPVIISKGITETNWLLEVTSDEIPLPSISSLGDFMGTNIISSASPSGLMGLGNFAIYNLDLKWKLGTNSQLELFAFSIQSTTDTPAWNLIPDYFSLTDLFVMLRIESLVGGNKDVSGAIGTTVKLVLNKEKDKNLVLGMVATKPASDKPWNFAGSLKEDLDLSELLLSLKLPADVVDVLPKLTVTQFDLAMEPTTKSFSSSMTIANTPENEWTIISVGTVAVTLDSLFFKIENYANNTDLEAMGSFNIGTEDKKCPTVVKAVYKEKIWNFTGTFTNNQGLTINDVLKKYINGIDGASIPQVAITYISISLEKGPSATPPKLIGKGKNILVADAGYSKLNFSINGILTIPVIESFSIEALVNVLYDSQKPAANQYNGTNVKGILKFGGLSFSVLANYANNAFSTYVFQLVYKNITAETTVDSTDPDIVKFDFQLKSTDPNKGLSLGDIITTLIEAATNEPASIPSPWDFINKIPLDGFGFVFTYNKTTKAKTIGVTYKPDINLGFIVIEELSLIYSPDANSDKGPVDFKVTKGSFLGIPIDQLANEEKPAWDLRKPEEAPKVPGLGDAAFKLENLSLGNQVAITGSKPPKSVVAAITDLEQAFAPEGDGKALPTKLHYDKNYGWLIGAQFSIIKYINVAVIFYDPVIYGLSIGVTGGQFQGLDFEILYKKVTDNVGVYQINLTLPDYVRKQNFGAVSVTLPSVSLSIYTNGDFLIDMGFPYNCDFSRSFGLEFSIFTGAGGFYFGVLSNDTATDFKLPAASGQFNPVIAFGIGIRAGLGRTFDKGILKAEVSLTLMVILEGIIAKYEAYNTSSQLQLTTGSDDAIYFRIKAQAGLAARIYGEINFVIISASVDITAKIIASLLVEAYRKTELAFYAEVSASVTVRINLGLFKISISCSFSTSYSDSFTLGEDSTAPWDAQKALPNRNAYFTSLDNPLKADIPEMNWAAGMVYPKTALSLIFVPQLSVKYKDTATTKKQAVGVSLLYIENAVNSAADSDFTSLSKAALAWAFNAYFSSKKGIVGPILDEVVTIDDLNAMLAYFNQDKYASGLDEPFGTNEILQCLFAQSFTSVTVNTQKESTEQTEETDEKSVAVFPMFPIFKMAVTGREDVDFLKYGAFDAAYLKLIKDYFKEMKIQFNQEQDPTTPQAFRDAQPATLAEYLFIDYFAMIMKSGIQDAINDFKQMTIKVRENESLDRIAEKHSKHGVSLQTLAFANRHQPMKSGFAVRIPESTYRLRHGETITHLIKRIPGLPVQKTLLAANPQSGENRLIRIPSFEYTSSANAPAHSLLSLSRHFNVGFEDLVAANAANKNLFRTGTKLIHAFVDQKTVSEILTYLQTDDKHLLSNIGGTVSRFFLHGLRIPGGTAADAPRKALYEATGQQFELAGMDDESSVSLQINAESTQPEWLKFEDATETKFDFTAGLITAIAQLEQATYQPISMTAQDDIIRYELQPKTFSLPDGTLWQNPNLSKMATGMGDSYLWKFPSKLQQFLADHPDVPMQLLLQAKNTSFSYEESKAVTPLFWSTSVQIEVGQVQSQTNAGEVLAQVYEVKGCGQADARMLEAIIQAASPKISVLDFLFAENKSKENGGKEVSGLTSDSLEKATAFLLQTNYSTVSNPSFFADGLLKATAYDNLIGMDAATILTYLWECSIVRSGGYYLYYNNGSGNGLPSHIFAEDGTASITLLIQLEITADATTGAYALPSYVNSVVLGQEVLTKEENLYLEPYLTEARRQTFDPELQSIQSTILPGSGLFKGIKTNPGLTLAHDLAESADQQLNELFNLLEYRINETEGSYVQSKFALPSGPTVISDAPIKNISAVPRRAELSDGWNYTSVLPVYRFATGSTQNPNPSLNTDPYAANGKPASIYFDLLDVFGNTLSDEISGTNGVIQEITPLYTDAVIGLDQWKNVSKYFDILLDGSAAVLNITLVFDTKSYTQEKEAQKVLQEYQKIVWQLAQPDIQVNVVSTLGSISMPAGTPLEALKMYVGSIISFLHTVGGTAPISEDPFKKVLSFAIDTQTLNSAYLFALNVELEIERTGNIDPQFEKEPAIRFSSSIIPPNLYKEKEKEKAMLAPGETDEKSALDLFAINLETALPVMKVAVGQSSTGPNPKKVHAERWLAGEPPSADGKEIWLMRYANGEQPGIQLSISQKPAYFALKPLSTKLISRPDEQHNNPVPMRTYVPGTYIGDQPVSEKSYSSVDIEVMAQACLAAIDNFLSADLSTTAWLVQNSNGSGSQNGDPDPKVNPFQTIEQAKRDLAKAIANRQLTNILEVENLDQLQAAKDATEQQLLITLSKAYSINAVLQNAVTVQQGFDTFQANVFGQLVVPGHEEDIKNAYSFSPVKAALTKSGDAADPVSGISSFFSVRPESNAGKGVNLIDHFAVNLDYNITNIEHQFGTPINGYVPSSWLSLVHPITVTGADNSTAVIADIPIPLMAYPTSPSLASQAGTATYDYNGEDGKTALEKAKKWNYSFHYDYVAALQDTIHVNVRYNIVKASQFRGNLEDKQLDLFEALMQFNTESTAVLADVKKNDANSMPALKSFAWMVLQVSTAWEQWFNAKLNYGMMAAYELNFTIHEKENVETGPLQGALLLNVSSTAENPSGTALPDIAIDGFKTVEYLPQGEAIGDTGSITYYFTNSDGSDLPLLYANRKQYAQRIVTLTDADILISENAWAGVSIHRNEVLAEKATNKDFQYITPYIRFAEPCLPSLYNQAEINIADFMPPVVGKSKLDDFLWNLFQALVGKNKPEIVIQVKCGYSYDLQQDASSAIQIGPTLPILLTTPAAISFESKPELLVTIATHVKNWFGDKSVEGVDENGKLRFVLSLYSSLSDDLNNPVLSLEGLYLDTRLVDFS